nr:MAG TPA: BRO family protein [Herelleviridae sp.]
MNKVELISSQELLGKEFNVYGTQEEPLFLAKDIKELLEHNNISLMLHNVDEEEKLSYVIHKSGQNRRMWFLTEYGLYEVLMQSRKPIAKKFKKKVKDILKDIRKYGIYINDDFAKAIIDNPVQARLEIAKYYNESERLKKLLEKYEGIEEELTQTEEKLRYLQQRPENSDWKTEANKRVRALAPKFSSVFNPNFGKAWNKVYREMLYGYSLNIKSKHTRRLKVMKSNNVPQSTIDQTTIMDTIGTSVDYADILFKAIESIEKSFDKPKVNSYDDLDFRNSYTEKRKPTKEEIEYIESIAEKYPIFSNLNK